ncbi:MAG: hypothetical protein FWE03_04855 [Firmicutes bacterium]|nr:hypothetical protein [Bacillota bacterium]
MKNCKICSEKTQNDNHNLCRDCYDEVLDYEIAYSRNARTKVDIEKMYKNEKYFVYFKSGSSEKFGYIKMVAQAGYLNNFYNEPKYLNVVFEDIAKLKAKKCGTSEITNIVDEEVIQENIDVQARQDNIIQAETGDFRKDNPANERCNDGHYVRSPNEQLIDNFLYDKGYRHAYENSLEDEQNGITYYPDWYLPDIGKGGTYIEFFGMMELKQYADKVDRKKEFYKRERIAVIELYKDNLSNMDNIKRIIEKHRNRT